MPRPDPKQVAARRANKKQLREVREEERRLARNQRRSQRGRQNRANNKAAARAEREVELAAMPPDEHARFLAAEAAVLEADRSYRAVAEAALAAALAPGADTLRLCIDVAFDEQMSAKEIRRCWTTSNFRPLIGIFSQKAGPSFTICTSRVQFGFGRVRPSPLVFLRCAGARAGSSTAHAGSLTKQIELSAGHNRDAAMAAAAAGGVGEGRLPAALTLTSFTWDSALGEQLRAHGAGPAAGLGKCSPSRLGRRGRPTPDG